MPDVERLLFEARRWGRREKFTHALKLYQQVLDVEPKNVEALTGKGGCHYKLGQGEEARDCWEKALHIDPKNEKVREFLDKLARGSNITIPSKSSIKIPKKGRPSAEAPPKPALRRRGILDRGRLPLIAGIAAVVLLLILASFVLKMVTAGPGDTGEVIANGPAAHNAGPAETSTP